MEIEYNNANNSKNKLHGNTTDMRRLRRLKLENIIVLELIIFQEEHVLSCSSRWASRRKNNHIKQSDAQYTKETSLNILCVYIYTLMASVVKGENYIWLIYILNNFTSPSVQVRDTPVEKLYPKTIYGNE